MIAAVKTLLTGLKARDRDGMIWHSLVVLFFTHLGSVANALFQIVMGWNLTDEEIGKLAPMMSLILMVAQPMGALQNTLAHSSGLLHKQGRLGDIKVLARRWILKIALLGIPLLVLGLVYHGRILHNLNLADHPAHVLLICATLFAMFMHLFGPILVGALQGMQAFVWMCLVANTWAIIRLVTGLWLVLLVSQTAAYGLIGHGIGQCFSCLVGCIALQWLLAGKSATGHALEGKFFYFFCCMFCLWLYSMLMNMDVVFVKHYIKNATLAGQYAQASQIARILVFLPHPISSALFPKVVSAGERSKVHLKTLLKAVLFASLIILCVLLFTMTMPWLFLLIIYRIPNPPLFQLNLVRYISLAMAPLGVTFIVLNYEMAQHRFSCIIPLLVAVIFFFAGIRHFNLTLWDMVTVFLIASLLALAGVLWVLFEPVLKKAGSRPKEVQT